MFTEKSSGAIDAPRQITHIPSELRWLLFKAHLLFSTSLPPDEASPAKHDNGHADSRCEVGGVAEK